jgi:hypothetical protein
VGWDRRPWVTFLLTKDTRAEHYTGYRAQKWASEGTNGNALYEFAVAQAQSLGLELNMDLSGHLVSDLPHAAI